MPVDLPVTGSWRCCSMGLLAYALTRRKPGSGPLYSVLKKKSWQRFGLDAQLHLIARLDLKFAVHVA